MKRPDPPLFLFVLLAGVSPLSTDIYTPAFPAMTDSLAAPDAAIQLTFSAFIVGMGVGQLVIGPLTDGFGRRPFLVGGTIMFTAMSVLCGLAPNVEVLLIARLVQGVAGSACLVTVRAIINDVHTPLTAGKRYATVAAFQSLLPIIGPVVGSLILLFGDWRTIFLFISALGVLMLTGSVWLIPESLPPERRSGTSLRANGIRIATLLRNRSFMGYVATSALACAGFFSYIAGAPLVLNAVYGFTSQQYGLFFAVNALGMAVTIAALRFLVRRVAVQRLLLTGLIAGVTSAAVLFAGALTGAPPLGLVWPCLSLLTCSIGFINPAGLILSQRAGAALAGTAAALHGGIQFTSGAIGSPLTGVLGHETVLPLSTVVLVTMLSALASNRIGAHFEKRRSSGPS